MKNARAVVPKIKIQDAVKQIIDSSKEEYIVGKKRDNLFLTQTPQAFNLKEIYHLHKTISGKYKDDDISLYMDLNKVKFIEGEKNNFKIYLNSTGNISYKPFPKPHLLVEKASLNLIKDTQNEDLINTSNLKIFIKLRDIYLRSFNNFVSTEISNTNLNIKIFQN